MNATFILLTLVGIILIAYLLYRVHMKRVEVQAKRRAEIAAKAEEARKAEQLDRVMRTVGKNKVRQEIQSAPPVDSSAYAEEARRRLEQRIPPPPRPTGHSSTNLAYTDRPRPSVNNPPEDYRYVDHTGLSPAFLHRLPDAPSVSTIDADRCASSNDSGYNHTSSYDSSSSSDCGSSSFSSD